MPRWRTLRQAAEELGVSRRTITRWISSGHLKAYKLPLDPRRYIDLDEVEALKGEFRPIEPPEKD